MLWIIRGVSSCRWSIRMLVDWLICMGDLETRPNNRIEARNLLTTKLYFRLPEAAKG